MNGSGNDTIYYVLSDHLGSMTTIVNATTSEVENYSFNAWGVPRDASDWTQSASNDLFADRGFTGHEHLPEFNLINMNGRIFDPILGRFLSPDPFVQAPGYPNNYNRYTYCLNNPLIYTDPSGYFYDPAEHEPKGWYIGAGGEVTYQNSWLGTSGDPFSGMGFDKDGHLAKGYGNTVSFRPLEAGPTWNEWANANPSYWSYNWETGQYENSATRVSMDAYSASRSLLPWYGDYYGAARTSDPSTIRFSLGLATDKGANTASNFIVDSNNQGFDAALMQYIYNITYALAWKIMLNSGPGTLYASIDGGGDLSTSEMGVNVNYGFGVGLKSPYGTAQVRIGNAKLWSLSYNGSQLQKSGFMRDDNILVFSLQYGLPLINAGGGLTWHTNSGLDIFGTFGASKFSFFNGLSVDGTTGYHLGIIGAEGYIRTNDFNSFIQTVPNARQQFFESTGYMWPLR